MALLTMVSMEAWAKIDVQINNDGKFDGGTIEVTGQKDLDDGVEVTITVAPNKGYTIKKGDISVFSTISPSGSRVETRAPEIAATLTLYYNGSEKEDAKDLSAKRDYTFKVPTGFGAWVKEAKFSSESKNGGTRTDYSGTYFIKSESPNKNTAGDYYICPTKNWYLYKATNTYEDDTDDDDDNGKPFLTTYQCLNNANYDESKAVWTIVKHPTKENCYYIIQSRTGRYMVSNGIIGSDANRMRVHLEDVADADALSDLGDLALFEITSHEEHIDLVPHSTDGRNGDYTYLVVNYKNFNELIGSAGKTGGPSGKYGTNTAGIIGLYNQETNHKWSLEPATPVTSAPNIINNFDGFISITAASGTIYYTTDGTDPTTSSSTYSGAITLTDDITVIKAMAKDGDSYESMVVTEELPKCEKPVITISSGNVSITSATAGASVYYTIDNTSPSSSSTLYSAPFPLSNISVIRAVAIRAGYAKSDEAYYEDFRTVSSSSEITNMQGLYRLASGFTSTAAIGTALAPFTGTIDGQMNTISGLDHPLVAYANGATIKNVILDNVTISGGTNAGAICNEATGETRIYNCGVLATDSGVETDKDGYTDITSYSSSVSGSGYVGGIVGLLDGSSRVINCFSYAEIKNGSEVGGIVGHNNVATTSAADNQKTMVMNCMFYGDITGGSSKAPIYNGEIITNRGDQSGVSNFNYFRQEAAFVRNLQTPTDKYNCALAAETRYLQRFEFFRHLLNSNRELAAWWATGSRDNKDEMMKWVLEPSQIGTSTPYPILKTPGRYKSIVYIDDLQINESTHKGTSNSTNPRLSTLNVTIQMGDGAVYGHPENASIVNSSLTLDILDKDPAHFNFNYKKVQLPYYNDVGTKNYTGNRVVTGWKIVSISDGSHHFTYDNDDAMAEVSDEGDITLTTPYNFADRHCTEKDLYSVSGRIFNQGAYWDVPEGVTAITIQPYWAKAAYLADAYADVTYNQNMNTSYNVPNVGGGQIYTNGNSYNINGDNQIVYTSITEAIGSSALNPSTSHTVYDYAVVLVGNYHHYYSAKAKIGGDKPYTITSIDLDGDNEPDYSYILRFDNRCVTHPVRVDFLNNPGLGMAQKSADGTGTYNFGIMQPKGWFETTNTAIFRVTQLEYDVQGRNNAPMILQGGVIEQWVTYAQNSSEANAVEYYHVGGNVWFKEFHIGQHQDRTEASAYSPHPPISVTGGDYDEFYLTGYYNTPTNNYPDNAECYINGGRFGKVAGTGMQGIGKTGGADNTGNIIWQIDNADIDEFYAGGMNAAHKAEGNIWTVISNSRVDQFCGGPKFGDMNDKKVVVTNATNCTFRTFFGAGYGGNSYNRRYPTNQNDKVNIDWNSWVSQEYTNKYNATYKGVETRIDYQFLPMSGNTLNVCRLFVDYVCFSLATTRDVTSKLTGCIITKSPLGRLKLFEQCLGNFYGGGSLGKVDGPVNSTLTDCTVEGNVFGAGYSATLPTVAVMNNSFQTEPKYDENLGAYLEAELPATKTYSWQHADIVNSTKTAINTTDSILYTTEDLTALGKVTGTATLNIDGTTIVYGNVYGGGEESNVEGDTQVNICTQYDNTSKKWESTSGTVSITGDVYGGGKGDSNNFECDKAMVGKNNDGACLEPDDDENKDKGTRVNIGNGTVNGNVYGGGEVGRVEWNTQVMIGAESGISNPVIHGNVFGAGAGVETHGYSALVRGNSTVTVQANAQVLQNVYGGGEKATVGRYWVKNIPATLCSGETQPTEPTDLPDGMPYQQRRGGICAVIVRGEAQVGPNSGGTETAGHVFGAGKGVKPNTYNFANFSGATRKNYPCRMALYDSEKYKDADKLKTWEYVDPDNTDTNKSIWEYFNTEEKYLTFLQTLALVTNSNVTIDGEAKVKGSVYGGSESGFVQHNTQVTILGSSEIGTTSANAYIFGGGLGLMNFAEAGIVKGNTSVNILGGTTNGTVFGGGSLGNVNGTTEVNVYAKKNDNDEYVAVAKGSEDVTITGDVFGGGMGSDESFTCEKAMVGVDGDGIEHPEGGTTVRIFNGTVNGNVYGGGEVGRVEKNTVVKIGLGEGGTDTSTPYIGGDVFGAGAGVKTHGFSALVRGNSTVTVEGDAQIGESVYGGGQIATVGRYIVINSLPTKPAGGGLCTVNIQGHAIIGQIKDGDVFGAGMGVMPDTSGNPWSMASDGSHTSYTPNTPAYFSYIQTLGLASDTEVTIGANAKVKGSVYGGSENGFVQRHTQVTIQGSCEIGKTSGSTDVDGDIYGGGRGGDSVAGYKEAGKVKGNTTVNINGGTMHGSVYGGGEMGYTIGRANVNVTDGIVNHDVYGGGALADTNKGNDVDDNEVNPYVEVLGLTAGTSSVEGLYENTYVDTSDTKALANKTYYTESGSEVIVLAKGASLEGLGTLYEEGNTLTEDVTAGEGKMYYNQSGDLVFITADTNIEGKGLKEWSESHYIASSGTAVAGKRYYTITHPTNVSLLGGTIKGDAYGGALGQIAREAGEGVTPLTDIPAYVYGDVLVELNNNNNGGTAIGTKKGCIVERVFGCNNMNGTPKGKVRVNVYATQNKDEETISSKKALHTVEAHNLPETCDRSASTYDVAAIYGGGNLSAYEPVDAFVAYTDEDNPPERVALARTEVYIYGCCLTSIKQVYAGGNAASVPATFVQVEGTWEIEELFGGGNGNDDYELYGKTYLNPGANVGYFNYTYPVWNETKGKYEAVEYTADDGSDKDASTLEKRYANYKYGSGITTTEVHGGKIHYVYGGSNMKGNIRYKCKSSYEEWYPEAYPDGCPVKIDETYGGGKQSAMDGSIDMELGCVKDMEDTFGGSKDADVNSDIVLTISNGNYKRVFGGNNTSGNINGSITVIIKEDRCSPITIKQLYAGGFLAGYSVYGYNADKSPRTKDQWNAMTEAQRVTEGFPTNAQGECVPRRDPRIMVVSATRIDSIFGGGYKALVVGNPHVNVNMEKGIIVEEYKENAAGIEGAVEDTKTHNMILPIGTIGNIYGGGNEAEIDGSTFVEIGTGYWHNQDGVLETISTDGKTYTYNESTKKWVDTEDATNTLETTPEPARYTATITGNVYGGGNNADVEENTNVIISGQNISTTETPKGSTTIAGSVYGGGNLGSVGTFDVIGTAKPTSCTTGTGLCTVTIDGYAEIGPDNMKMITATGYPNDAGHVFGASRGEVKAPTGGNPSINPEVDYKTFVDMTEVTIGGYAFVKGSVYGGSENGHVLHDTHVVITDKCQIGNGDGVNRRYTDAEWAYDGSDDSKSLAECAHWIFDKDDAKPFDIYDYQTGEGNTAKPKNAKDGHTFYGNVFGGGSGYYPYGEGAELSSTQISLGYSKGAWLREAGAVYGNTVVDITGGHILTSVYGGNEQTDVTGTCTINMSDGTVGVPRTVEQMKAHPVTCYVFGAGKGDQRINFNTWTNVASTQVNISGKARIFGSTFGGGEDGHVIGNAVTTISKGDKITVGGKEIEYPYIGTTGTSGVDGNIFGGGRGFSETALTAGVVGGNATVNFHGGTVLGTVFGGGRLASVGTYFANAEDASYGKMQSGDDHGKITINIDGGTIGATGSDGKLATSGFSIGDVFGGSKGSVNNKLDFGLSKHTFITMTGGKVNGSVYGGGEVAVVEGNTTINISGGEVGDGVTEKGGDKIGNVYGGGKGNTGHVKAGLIMGNTNVTIQDGTSGNTTTTPRIYHNVYGGGAYGSVGTFNYDSETSPTANITGLKTENTGAANITITGGTIGTNGNENGMIFGSSRGDVAKPVGNPAIDPNDKLAWVYSTDVKIGNSGQGSTLTTPQIYGSVYGSGENGHTWQNTVIDIYSGTIGTVSKDDAFKLTEDGVTYVGADYPYRGNVYGGGCGTDKYASTDGATKDTYNPLAGIVRGTTTVNIRGGQVAHNVYGAGAMGSVGGSTDAGAGKTTINITGGRIGDDGVDDGNIYGAARGDTDYTGANSGNLAQVRETDVNIQYATTPASDNEGHTEQLITGSVFGGGEAGIVTGDVAVNMLGGRVLHDVYGGGALASSNKDQYRANDPTDAKTIVNLLGGAIEGDAYGGGLGRLANESERVTAVEAFVGNTKVNLNGLATADYVEAIHSGKVQAYKETESSPVYYIIPGSATGCSVRRVFGCNNLNGTPKGSVVVHVYRTQGYPGHQRTVSDNLNKEDDNEHKYHSYEVDAVYGGGNLSAYIPKDLDEGKTHVIIEGCDLTSIRQVYGGGNAASTPATLVDVHGSYEIEEVFGGGNGMDDISLDGGTTMITNPGANVGFKDYWDYTNNCDLEAYNTKAKRQTDQTFLSNYVYGSGKAEVNINSGRVHRVFGGSNTRGNVRETALTILEDEKECEFFNIDEAYGGGKSAPMDAEAKLLLSCIPQLKVVYGGAQDADISNDVVLNISNGTFDRVFGGNNKSGSIHGTITVNIEETGCKPVIIGQLYGGGNLAPYTGPLKAGSNTERQGPTVNVKAFTSIGEIYGGGFGAGADVTGDTYVNINEVILSNTETDQTTDYSKLPFIQQEVVDAEHPLKEYEEIELSDGSKYRLWNRPVKNAGKEDAVAAMGVIGNVYGGGNEAKVIGNTYVNIGNKETETIVTLNNLSKDVKGVDIRGNVYGGGNQADVTGDTNVKVGKE